MIRVHASPLESGAITYLISSCQRIVPDGTASEVAQRARVPGVTVAPVHHLRVPNVVVRVHRSLPSILHGSKVRHALTSAVVPAVFWARSSPARLAFETRVTHADTLHAIAISPVRAFRGSVGVVDPSGLIRPRRTVRAHHEAAIGPLPSCVAATLSRGGRTVRRRLARPVPAAEVRRARLACAIGCCPEPQRCCGRREPPWEEHTAAVNHYYCV